MVRPCDEDEIGAYSEKNARCGLTGEQKERAAKHKRERFVLERFDRGGAKDDNTTNRAECRNTIISCTGDPGQLTDEEEA